MTRIEINGDMAFSATYLHPERVCIQYGDAMQHRLELNLPYEPVVSGWMSKGSLVCWHLPGGVILINARETGMERKYRDK